MEGKVKQPMYLVDVGVSCNIRGGWTFKGF